MVMNKIFIALFLITCVCAIPKLDDKVPIPEECVNSCPINGNRGNLLCAKNLVTGQLGTFESNCILSRYNSCFRTAQKYEFVNYGEC